MSHKRFDCTLIPGQRLLICIMCAPTERATPGTLQRSASFSLKELYSATNVVLVCVCVSFGTDSAGQGTCLLLCLIYSFIHSTSICQAPAMFRRQHARNWGHRGE